MSSFASLPLAVVGKVGEGFIHERSSGTLPCQANSGHFFCWDWATEHINRYGTPTLQQFELVVISLVLGFAVAFVVALLTHRQRWLKGPVLAATAIIFTIPSLAAFFLLLPITGLGRTTAIVVLAAYTLQIIYRNMTLGLENVPASVVDAARGMGLTDRQILWRVELPLATPEIIAGLRVATVSTIAIATLATFISAGGLGSEILGSANLTFPTTIIIAGTIVVLMALGFDVVLLAIQRLLTPWRRARAI